METIAGKKDTIKQLKERIFALEGFSNGENDRELDFGLGEMNSAFPCGRFPLGVIHEFISSSEVSAAATNGFLSGLLSTLIKKGGICIWISSGRKLFPPAMKFFNIEPHRIIFIDIRQHKEVLWVMEQALKCKAVTAVAAELRDVSFAESRRLQLAVESSRVTGFLHRRQPRSCNTLGCVSRWKITPLPSLQPDGIPGVGFPRVEVELEKIRNGRPGIWKFGWRNGSFTPESEEKPASLNPELTFKQQNYA